MAVGLMSRSSAPVATGRTGCGPRLGSRGGRQDVEHVSEARRKSAAGGCGATPCRDRLGMQRLDRFIAIGRRRGRRGPRREPRLRGRIGRHAPPQGRISERRWSGRLGPAVRREHGFVRGRMCRPFQRLEPLRRMRRKVRHRPLVLEGNLRAELRRRHRSMRRRMRGHEQRSGQLRGVRHGVHRRTSLLDGRLHFGLRGRNDDVRQRVRPDERRPVELRRLRHPVHRGKALLEWAMYDHMCRRALDLRRRRAGCGCGELSALLCQRTNG